MQLIEDNLYHVYNRGNNKQQVFFGEEHYIHFMKLMQKNIYPYCDILAWCLMPNHFHFLINANAKSVPIIKDGSFERQQFSQGVKQLLSSYTKAINVEMDFTGSRFQQKTKAKEINTFEYASTAFNYIHQNPVQAKLVSFMEEWKYSSFNEYANDHSDGFCNKKLAFALLGIQQETFYRDACQALDDELVKKIF